VEFTNPIKCRCDRCSFTGVEFVDEFRRVEARFVGASSCLDEHFAINEAQDSDHV
jgi:hypothetical protein